MIKRISNKNKIKSVSIRSKPDKSQNSGINNKHTKSYLIKKIAVSNLLSIAIIVATYFWMIFFLSNVSSFWDIFRKKELNANEKTYLPPTPYIDPLSEAYKDSNLNITGKSLSGYKIKLFIDDEYYTETVADTNGSFNFTGIPLSLLPESFHVIAIDSKGVESAKSVSYNVVLDKDPPDLTITQPKEKEEHKDTGHSYNVIGKTEPGAKVWVNNQLSIVNANGEFTKAIRLEEGKNEIKVKAVDKAGNEKEEKINVVFIKIQ